MLMIELGIAMVTQLHYIGGLDPNRA